MDRARRQGKKMGRPRVIDRRGLKNRFARISPTVLDGHKSIGETSSELGISRRSFRRYMDVSQNSQCEPQEDAK